MHMPCSRNSRSTNGRCQGAVCERRRVCSTSLDFISLASRSLGSACVSKVASSAESSRGSAASTNLRTSLSSPGRLRDRTILTTKKMITEANPAHSSERESSTWKSRRNNHDARTRQRATNPRLRMEKEFALRCSRVIASRIVLRRGSDMPRRSNSFTVHPPQGNSSQGYG